VNTSKEEETKRKNEEIYITTTTVPLTQFKFIVKKWENQTIYIYNNDRNNSNIATDLQDYAFVLQKSRLYMSSSRNFLFLIWHAICKWYPHLQEGFYKHTIAQGSSPNLYYFEPLLYRCCSLDVSRTEEPETWFRLVF
jgi:hypothetical protein